MSPIVIVDYGMGNITSVKNAFDFLGANSIVSNAGDKLKNARAIVLPGVGAFSAAMQNLQRLGLIETLSELVMNKQIPFLGICLGMQLLADESTELRLTSGLGWVKGHVNRIETQSNFRVPHVGWNEVSYPPESILFDKIEKNSHFYFDHSYHFQCQTETQFATCDYGNKLIAAIEKNNIFAVQFHPEKSQRNGLKVLRNFLNYVARG